MTLNVPTPGAATAACNPSTLPAALYTAAQVRELDRQAIEVQGVPGIQLMKRAGRAVFNVVQNYASFCSETSPLVVVCGAGNNAGDGYVVAALAAERSIPVRLLYLANPCDAKGDAARAVAFAEQAEVSMAPYCDALVNEAGLIVDALLGTGLQGEVRPDYAAAINAINQSSAPVIAVDIPSGLCADTGAVLGTAVQAMVTVTFIGMKLGLVTGRGPALAGTCLFDDLAVPAQIYSAVPAAATRLDLAQLLAALPARTADAHKGDFGHTMVIGGELGFTGAALMAAEMAARSGSGLTSLATRPEGVAAAVARRPEIMTTGVPSGQALEPLLTRPTVLVVGPGLGQTPWSEQLLQQAASTKLPLVLDADALNIMAQGRLLGGEKRENWILTPHPGEAARLLGCTTAQVQADRLAAAQQLQQRFGGAVLLKGAGSVVVTTDGAVAICCAGNPGMASGGMGDVLSGLLGGLLAQGLSIDDALKLGVLLHASAADEAVADSGERGLLAADLIPYVRSLLNSMVSNEVEAG